MIASKTLGTCGIKRAWVCPSPRLRKAVLLETDEVSEDFTLSEILLRNVMAVPIRLKVRLEAFPKDIPTSVWSNFLQYPGWPYALCAMRFISRSEG